MHEWWREAFNMVVMEFSDLPTFTEFVRIILRLMIAAISGALLGPVNSNSHTSCIQVYYDVWKSLKPSTSRSYIVYRSSVATSAWTI